MSKKILSVVLAVMLVLSTLAVSAFALGSHAESAEDAATYTQTWALEAVNNEDGTYTVKVKLTTNYATGAIQFKINNSNSNVTLDKEASAIGAGIPDSYDALFQCSDAGKVLIVPQATGTVTAEQLTDAVIAELVYTVPAGESAKLSLAVADAKTETNIAGTLVALRAADEVLDSGDMVYGQTVIDADNDSYAAIVTIGSDEAAEAPTLAVIDGTIGVIDTTRQDEYCDEMGTGTGDATFTGYIYGVEPENGETVDAIFEVVGDGTMEIVANEAGSEAGTGTIVNVLDLDGNVVETYVLVIFGDVNGDGSVDTSDSGDIELHDNWGYEAGPDGMRMGLAYQVFAGDIAVDGSVDTSDSGDIELHDNWAYEAGSDGMRMYQADVIANLA